MTTAPVVTPADLGTLLATRRDPGEVMIVGLTGSVAVGKSVLAGQIAEALKTLLRVEVLEELSVLRTLALQFEDHAINRHLDSLIQLIEGNASVFIPPC